MSHGLCLFLNVIAISMADPWVNQCSIYLFEFIDHAKGDFDLFFLYFLTIFTKQNESIIRTMYLSKNESLRFNW